MKVIILAGGGGSRLFPLSRTCYPKQFMKMENGKSFLVNTILRFFPLVKPEDIIIVTNKEYVYHVQNELEGCSGERSHILVEPIGKNTAPAIALAVRYCQDILGCDNDEALFVAPADHVIQPVEDFTRFVEQGKRLAEMNFLVTYGIKPDKPEIGYGYIEAGEKNSDAFMVKAFKEKPAYELAESYLKAGNYYWNSGMFVFSLGFILDELNKYQKEIHSLMKLPYEDMVKSFGEMPNISIDYAVAEKSQSVMMIPLDCYWNDIGSWDAMYDILPKDKLGNALQGDCISIGCKNSLFIGKDRLIAGIGLDDLLLVETDDVIVVAKKGESQKVKDIVNKLKQDGRKEATEHTTLYRPWGSTSLLGEGERYRMKKIRVKPGGKLSLQMHYHRSEHWVVIAGTAKVTIGDKVMMVHENESIFIPQTTKHSLENPGKIYLEIIEVQNGSYIGEDDIIRFDANNGLKSCQR